MPPHTHTHTRLPKASQCAPGLTCTQRLKTPGSVGSEADKDNRCLSYLGKIRWALPCAHPVQTFEAPFVNFYSP